MTANQDIGREAAEVFNALAKDETVEQTQHLMVAPHCLQNKVIDLIDAEIEHARAGEEAYIGVKIDLIVRGICCLIAGVPGQTENIRVTSIVGRFLEHSRIYIFGPRARAKVYIASADFMTRNTLRRVEVAAPILDEGLRGRLLDQFDTMLHDNVQARVMLPDGGYVRRERGEDAPLSAQEFFYQQAYDAAGK